MTLQLQKIKVGKVTRRNFSGFVYNLSVKRDESYFCNSVSVHNCRSRVVAVLESQTEKPKLNPPKKSIVKRIKEDITKTKI